MLTLGSPYELPPFCALFIRKSHRSRPEMKLATLENFDKIHEEVAKVMQQALSKSDKERFSRMMVDGTFWSLKNFQSQERFMDHTQKDHNLWLLDMVIWSYHRLLFRDVCSHHISSYSSTLDFRVLPLFRQIHGMPYINFGYIHWGKWWDS